MKKLFTTLLCVLAAQVATNAQSVGETPFLKDKFYVGTHLSGLDLNWNKDAKWRFDVGAKAGILFDDNWMITAQADYSVRHTETNLFSAGAGLRYYFDQCGIYLGAGGNYVHGLRHTYHGSRFDDFMPTVQVGYAFFLNRTVTIEPELYYNHSFKDHCDYSGVGFRIGFGIYFE